ncbi:MAG: acetate--CoA ligase family protein [Candidatus Dormibacteraeota bacterium]|nr:acetate--CoA ligase family protein [Candidatus Dormibacteraeota bacterium]
MPTRLPAAGAEMIVGVVQDPQFGPVLACGAGGTAVELVNDVSVRLTPLNETDADEMIRSLATFPLLDGYRGRPKADLDSLSGLLLRVGALADDIPGVAELDLNPVLASSDGARAVDARVRLEGREQLPAEGARPRSVSLGRSTIRGTDLMSAGFVRSWTGRVHRHRVGARKGEHSFDPDCGSARTGRSTCPTGVAASCESWTMRFTKPLPQNRKPAQKAKRRHS